MITALLILGSYLIGSLNSAILVSRFLLRRDIRTHDHAGASGGFRQYGPAIGILILALDLIKGLLVGLACFWLLPSINSWVTALAGLALIAGHDWPIFFRFEGGGGMAPGFAFVLVILPLESAVLGGVTLFLALLFWKTPLARVFHSVDRPIPTAAIITILGFFIWILVAHGFLWYGAMVLFMGLTILVRRIGTTWAKRSKKEPKHDHA